MLLLLLNLPKHELQAVPSPNAVAKKYSNSVISFSVKPTSSPPPQHFSLDTFRSMGCLHLPLCVLFAQHVPATQIDTRIKNKQTHYNSNRNVKCSAEMSFLYISNTNASKCLFSLDSIKFIRCNEKKNIEKRTHAH